jgi:hypothetical protein
VLYFTWAGPKNPLAVSLIWIVISSNFIYPATPVFSAEGLKMLSIVAKIQIIFASTQELLNEILTSKLSTPDKTIEPLL